MRVGRLGIKMKYNKFSLYEKPIEECPTKCQDCEAFCENYGMGWCRANGGSELTYSFSNPFERPVPFPLSCYWWYANSVLNKLSPSKIEGMKERRLHHLAFSALLNSQILTQQRRDEIIKHYFRPGGGGIIDAEQFPEFVGFYEMVKTNDESYK